MKMSEQFPPNDKMKLIFTVRTDDFAKHVKDDKHHLISYFGDIYLDVGSPTKNYMDAVIEELHAEYHFIFRSERKHKKKVDIFLVTTDNDVIRYQVNPLKRGSVKIMQKYKPAVDDQYIYVGGAYEAGGAHFELGGSAKEVFIKLMRMQPDRVDIFKISVEYCMRPGDIFGAQTIPTTDKHKAIEAHLIQCSKNWETFYRECMMYIPYEVSFINPDGTVSASYWEIDWSPSKNAHMMANPYWRAKMLDAKIPHLWDFVDFKCEHPNLIIDDTFGTVDDL